MINTQKIPFFLLLCVVFCNGCPTEECFGDHEIYACDNDCDNECSTLGRQNRTNCRSNNKTCMCYCEDGYARDENNICIPVDNCKSDQCLRSNEVLRCRYRCPPEITCKTRAILFSCLRNDTEVCEDKCVCRTGYYRNTIGDCISNAQCDQCSGQNEFFSCGTECDNECGKIGFQNRTNCPKVNIMCNEKCYCEDGFSRNENKICVPNLKCPNVRCPQENENLACFNGDSEPTCKNRTPESDVMCRDCEPKCLCDKGLYRNAIGECVSAEDCATATCGQNEIYRCVTNCPPKATCDTRNATYFCPLQGEDDLCKSKCVCKSGFYRNYLGECISSEDCDKCNGEHEFYSPCGGACDNRCGSLDTVNRTNCNEATFACVASCYCEDGFARDDNNICVPVADCTKGCGLHEYRMNCLRTCPPDECFSIVARFKCDPEPPCLSGCRCQVGFLRQGRNKPCMPIRNCPELVNSPDYN